MSEALPKNWVTTEIGLVCQLINGKAFKPSDWVDAGLPIVRIQNLNDPKAPFNYYDGQLEKKFLIDSGTLLFAWSGTPSTSFGAHIWNGGPAVLNQHIFKVEVDEGRIDKKFLRFAINQKLQELISKAHGGAGLRHITKGAFKRTEIRLAPTREQKRIVKKINALMERNRKAKEALCAISKQLDQCRKYVLLAAFRGDLTSDLRNSQSNLGQHKKVVGQLSTQNFPEPSTRSTRDFIVYDNPQEQTPNYLPIGWDYIRLGELASFDYGSPKKSNPSGKVPVLRMGNIQNGKLDWSHLVYTSDTTEINKYSLAYGDVLFNRTNSPELVGKSAHFNSNRNAIYAGYLIRIRTLEVLDPEFLTFYLNSPIGRDYCRHVKSDGVNQSNINAKKLAMFKVPMCSKEEQTIIVSRIKIILSVIENLCCMVEDMIDKIAVIDEAVVKRAFKGELVRQDPTDEPARILLENIRAEREEKDIHSVAAKKNYWGKSMVRKRGQMKVTSVVDTLRQAKYPLSGQELLAQAGYPNKLSTDELELFFLDVREQLNKGIISCERRGDEDYFTLME